MKATVIETYPDGAELIEINGHKIQFGYGFGGDGYCYSHGSFKCIDNLTDKEKEAVKNIGDN